MMVLFTDMTSLTGKMVTLSNIWSTKETHVYCDISTSLISMEKFFHNKTQLSTDSLDIVMIVDKSQYWYVMLSYYKNLILFL